MVKQNKYLTRKLWIISQLKAKGIKDKALYIKIMNSGKTFLNKTHRKYIVFSAPSYKKTFETLVQYIWKQPLNALTMVFQNRLDDILKHRYNYNVNVQDFQDLVDLIQGNIRLQINKIEKYRNFKETTKTRHINKLKALEYFLHVNYGKTINFKDKKLQDIKDLNDYIKTADQLLDHIDWCNFLEQNWDSKVLQKRLKIKHLSNYGYHSLSQFIKGNKLARELFRKLKIENSFDFNFLLSSELKDLYKDLYSTYKIQNNNLLRDLREKIKDFKVRMYRMIHGEDKSENGYKITKRNGKSIGAFPFNYQGEKNMKDREIDALNYCMITMNKENFKNKKIENIYNAKNIEVIDVLEPSEAHRDALLVYLYRPTNKQVQDFQNCLNNLEIQLSKQKNNREYHRRNYRDVDFSFDYGNKREKLIQLQKLTRELSPIRKIRSYIRKNRIFPELKLGKNIDKISYNKACYKEISEYKVVSEDIQDNTNQTLVETKEIVDDLGNIKIDNSYYRHKLTEKQKILVYTINYLESIEDQPDLVQYKDLYEWILKHRAINVLTTMVFNELKIDLSEKFNQLNEVLDLYEYQINDLVFFTRSNKLDYRTQAKYLRELERVRNERNNCFKQQNKLWKLSKHLYYDKTNVTEQKLKIVRELIQKYYSGETIRIFNTRRPFLECLNYQINVMDNLNWCKLDNNSVEETDDQDEWVLKFGNILDKKENISPDDVYIPLKQLFRNIVKIYKNINPTDYDFFPFIQGLIEKLDTITKENLLHESKILNS